MPFRNLIIRILFSSSRVAARRLKGKKDHGRMFPVTDSAKTILETFIQEVKKLGVQVRTNVKVKTIRLSDGAVQ